MDKFQRLRVLLIEVDSGDTRIVNLLPELAEVRTTLVPNPCLWEQSATLSSLKDAFWRGYRLLDSYL